MRRIITAVVLVLALGVRAQAWDGGPLSDFGWINDLWDYFRPTPKKTQQASASAHNASAPEGYKQAIQAYEKQRQNNATAHKPGGIPMKRD